MAATQVAGWDFMIYRRENSESGTPPPQPLHVAKSFHRVVELGRLVAACLRSVVGRVSSHRDSRSSFASGCWGQRISKEGLRDASPLDSEPQHYCLVEGIADGSGR